MPGEDRTEWYWVPDKRAVFAPATLDAGAGASNTPGATKFRLNGTGALVEVKMDDCHAIVDTVLVDEEKAATLIADLSKMIDVFSGSILQVSATGITATAS